MDRSLLVVRHGPGRGRLPGFMEPALARLRTRSPSFAHRLRVHETGHATPSLDGVGAVVLWLADPLRERYPECHREAVEIESEARRRGVRVVNPPDSLSNSVKSRQARLWRAAGLDTPPVRRFEDARGLPDVAAEVGLPFVIRGDEEHWQEGLQVVRTDADLAAIDPSRLRFPAAASPLCDVRESWRAKDGRSVYARLHHKKRAYVLLDRVCSEHVFFARGPIVTARTCTFAGFHGWRRPLSPLARLFVGSEIAEDAAYWRGPNAHAETLRRAASALGLGFVALDYSVRADGSPVLWEANPYPFLPPASRMLLPRRRRADERLERYHDAIADFLVRCLDPTPSEGVDSLRTASSVP